VFPRGCGEIQPLALSQASHAINDPHRSAGGAAEVGYEIPPEDQLLGRHTGSSSKTELLRCLLSSSFGSGTQTKLMPPWIGLNMTPPILRTKVRAQSLFETLDMPQKPDALRILDLSGDEVFFWSPERSSA
jgi:hypothetical protein